MPPGAARGRLQADIQDASQKVIEHIDGIGKGDGQGKKFHSSGIYITRYGVSILLGNARSCLSCHPPEPPAQFIVDSATDSRFV